MQIEIPLPYYLQKHEIKKANLQVFHKKQTQQNPYKRQGIHTLWVDHPYIPINHSW